MGKEVAFFSSKGRGNALEYIEAWNSGEGIGMQKVWNIMTFTGEFELTSD